MAEGWLIPIIAGGVFIILGLGVLFWGRREEKAYYESLTSRSDLREFFSRWPKRPEPGSLKIGGWIGVAVGVVLVIVGAVFGLIPAALRCRATLSLRHSGVCVGVLFLKPSPSFAHGDRLDTWRHGSTHRRVGR